MALRLPAFFLLAGFFSFLHAKTWCEIPHSRSPDGQSALFYQQLSANPKEESFALYICRAGPTPVSAQLIPDMHGRVLGDGNSRTEEDFFTGALLSDIARRNVFERRGEKFDSAFSCEVRWTPDSQWLSIEGGAHKFWDMVAYHKVRGRFQSVELGDLRGDIVDWFNRHQSNLAIQKLGVDAKVRGISPPPSDWAYVGWLEDGLFAVNGYPFLLNDPRYGTIREKGESYFLIDCHDINHVKIVGLSR